MSIEFNTIKSKITAIPNKSMQECGKIGSFVIEKGYKVLKKDTYEKPVTFQLKNKETILGIGMLLAAALLAIKGVKELYHKIKETREK